MPYNPSTGVYSLPAIYLAVPGTVIIAAQHNTPLVDLQTANNYERPIIAGGTGAGSIAGVVDNFSLVQYTAQTLDDAQKAQARLNIGSATAGTFEQKSANYPVLAEDLGKTFLFTASATASFDAAADLGANFECEIWANFGVTVTLDPDASETINGASTFILQPGDKVTVWCDGTALFAKATGDPTVGPQIQGYASGLALTTNVTDPTNDVDFAAGVAASDTSPYYLMQFSALTKRLDATFTAGNNGGMLDTGAVGNNTYYLFGIGRSDTGGTDYLASLSSTAPTMPTNYDRKRLLGLLVRSAGVNSTPYLNAKSISNIGPILIAKGPIPAAAATDWAVPAGVRRLTLELSAFSTNGTSVPIVQLRTGGAPETSGYAGSVALFSSASTTTGPMSVGFSLTATLAAVTVMHLVVELLLQDGNTWMATVKGGLSNQASLIASAGSKTLAGALDGIRLTTVAGVDLPDAGSYTLYAEF